MREDASKLYGAQFNNNQRSGAVIYNGVGTHSWNDHSMNGYVHSYVSNRHIHTCIYIYIFARKYKLNILIYVFFSSLPPKRNFLEL